MGTVLFMSTTIIESFQPQSSLSHHRIMKNPINIYSNIISDKNMMNQKLCTGSQIFRNTLQMSSEKEAATSNLPMLLDPGTKGGALFLSLVLFIVPIIVYQVVTLGFGVDGVEAGKWIGAG